ncbi:MAG: peptidylprolyl isomerase, partial [Mangrovicoccus sp.]|nr:peptidylprolyl isomerase [Mangrovicoccus sp.]
MGSVLFCLGAAPATAQDLFAPVAFVDNAVVTEFELQQRELLLKALRSPAVTRASTLDELINERLQLAAAAGAGIVPSQDEIDFALESFAGRAGLGPDEFLFAIQDAGIDPETMRDYLRAQLSWSGLVQARFAARARVGEEEIDRALALSSGTGSARILVSEVVLPMTPQEAVLSQRRAEEIQRITSFAEFEDAARQYSIGPSSINGGKLDWLPVSALPPTVGPLFLTMRPGEVTAPVPLEGSIALFQLRQLQDVAPPPSKNVQIDYAKLRLPTGSSPAAEIARLKPQVDDCNGFFGENPNAAEGQ